MHKHRPSEPCESLAAVNVAATLPLTVVMVAGPQIISAFFFAMSDDWRRTSAAYVVGAIASITLVASAAYLLASGAEGSEESGLGPVDYVILALLLFAMVYVFRGRKDTEPPSWMGSLQSASSKTALLLGFLLLGFFPSDLVTSVSVGSRLADTGDPWSHVLPFVLLTALLLATPALMVVAMGARAQVVLPKIRSWIDTNSWIVSEGVIVFFIVIVLTG
jgi:hypothetical protein